MLTGTFNLYGIMDGENANYMQLTCSLPVVSVDENNVQADAAVFRLVEVNGSTQTVIPAWFRLKVMSGNVVLDTIDQTVVRDELSYMLPTDRYGNADKLLVEAYRDDHETEGSYDEKLAELTVLISRRNPIPFPRPEEWSAGLTFRNGEYLMVGNIVYMWRNPVPGNSELPPEQDIEKNPQKTSWVAYQNWPLLATQIFLAQWAKLGSFIFNGDIQMSQQGTVNGQESSDYRNPDFEPNYEVNALTGKVKAKDMNITGGTIGPLEINKYGIGIIQSDGIYRGVSLSAPGFAYASDDISVNLGETFAPSSGFQGKCCGYFHIKLPRYTSLPEGIGTVVIESSGGEGGLGQRALVVRTSNGENDVAMDIVGRVKVNGKKGYTGGIGFDRIWIPSIGQFKAGDLYFQDGILYNFTWHD